jgi:hypothetical protein
MVRTTGGVWGMKGMYRKVWFLQNFFLVLSEDSLYWRFGF